jgi:hypothetical protein
MNKSRMFAIAVTTGVEPLEETKLLDERQGTVNTYSYWRNAVRGV